MFDLTCLIHGSECTDIFHILFCVIVLILGIFLCVLLFTFLVVQIDAIIRDRSRVSTMYDTYYSDRHELIQLRKKLDQLSQEVSSDD